MQAARTNRWTPREDELLRTLPAKDAANKLTRSLAAILVAAFDSDRRAKRWVREPRRERLRSLAGPTARNIMSRNDVMPARSSATLGSASSTGIDLHVRCFFPGGVARTYSPPYRRVRPRNQFLLPSAQCFFNLSKTASLPSVWKLSGRSLSLPAAPWSTQMNSSPFSNL